MHNFYESMKECKDQELIQSSTTPDPGYQSQLDIANESQEVSPFPADEGINKQTRTKALQKQDRHYINENIFSL